MKCFGVFIINSSMNVCTYACRCVCRDEESVKYMQWLVIPMEEFQVYVAVPTQVISYNLSFHDNSMHACALQKQQTI